MNALELNANSKFLLLWLKKIYHQMDQLLLCLDNLDGVRVNNLLDDSALILLFCFYIKPQVSFKTVPDSSSSIRTVDAVAYSSEMTSLLELP